MESQQVKPQQENTVSSPTAMQLPDMATADNPIVSATEAVPGVIKSDNVPEVIGPNYRPVKRTFIDNVRLFLLPIFVLAVFVGLFILGVAPNVNQIFNVFDQIGQKNNEFNQEFSNLQELQKLASKSAQIDNDIALVNKQAGIEGASAIVNFQTKIANLAKQNNITVIGQKSGENIIAEDESTQQKQPVGLIEVPSEFQLEGSFSNLQKFVQALNVIDDFIVIGKMDLQTRDRIVDATQQSSALWKMDVRLIKYLFQEADEKNQLRSLYLNVSPSQQADQQVLNFINKSDTQ